MSMLEELVKQTKELQSEWGGDEEDDLLTPDMVSIPVSIKTPRGNLRVYFHYSKESMKESGGLLAKIKSLCKKNIPLNFWKDRSSDTDDWGVSKSNDYRKKKGWY